MNLIDVGTNLTNAPFATDFGIVILQANKGTQWVAFIVQSYFDSYGVHASDKLTKFDKKCNGHCQNSDYKIQSFRQKRDSYFAAHCLYKIYLPKVLGMDLISAVLDLYQQMRQYPPLY